MFNSDPLLDNEKSSYTSSYNSENMDSIGSLLPPNNLSLSKSNSLLFNHNNSLTRNLQSNNEETHYSLIDNKNLSIFPIISRTNSLDNQSRQALLFRAKTPASWIQFSSLSSFGWIKCDTITTYFLGQVSYSQFTYPDKMINDPRCQIRILYRGKKNWSNSESITNNTELFRSDNSMKLPRVDRGKMNQFITELNEFFVDSEYINTLRSLWLNKWILKSMLAISMLIVWFCIGMIVLNVVHFIILGNSNLNAGNIIKTTLYLLIVVLMGLWTLYFAKKVKYWSFKFLEGTWSYRIRKAEQIEQFIYKWNYDYFSDKHIRMWCPISWDYVLFSLDMFQDFQIEGHILKECKNNSCLSEDDEEML